MLKGHGVCRACVGVDPVAAEAAFRARLAELDATLLEERWLGNQTPHRVLCVKGHPCTPRPATSRRDRASARPAREPGTPCTSSQTSGASW
ncbi:hypothetical protein ACR6C2_07930 [Streptomyces sp. INA 01156]